MSQELQEFLSNYVTRFTSPGSYKMRRTSAAFYRRGILGYCVDENFKATKNIKYTFKRLSKKRRIFGLVPIEQLDFQDESNLDQCMCAEHRGGQRVNLKTPYNEDDYITFFETGMIKG